MWAFNVEYLYITDFKYSKFKRKCGIFEVILTFSVSRGMLNLFEKCRDRINVDI